MRLLAAVNRRVAQRDSCVSPFCHVSFIDEERTSPRSQSFTERGEQAPFEMPVLLFGIDLTDVVRLAHEQSTVFFRDGTPPPEQSEADIAELDKGLQRRP